MQYDKILSIQLKESLFNKPDVISCLSLKSLQDEHGLWGFVIMDTDIVIIPCQYDCIKEFEGAYAIVRNNRYWGVIDKCGNTIVNFTYYQIENDMPWWSSFEPLGFCVSKGNISNWGYCNLKGKQVIPCEHTSCYRVGQYILAKKPDIIYDIEGQQLLNGKTIETLLAFEPPFLLCTHDGKYGVLDYNLETLVPTVFQTYDKYLYEEGIDPTWGIFREDDEHDDYSFRLFENTPSEETQVLHFSYYDVKVYRGYVDREDGFKERIPSTVIVEFTEYALSRHKFLKMGFNNKDPNDYIYSKEDILHHEYTIVLSNRKKIRLTGIEDLDVFYDELAVFRKDGKYGVFDREFNTVCHPVYDKIDPFKFGTAIVENNGLKGLINACGEETIPCRYQSIYFGSGMPDDSSKYITVVDKHGDMGIYDTNGNCICPVRLGQRIEFDRDGNFESFIL